jgi:hypothetical protein
VPGGWGCVVITDRCLTGLTLGVTTVDYQEILDSVYATVAPLVGCGQVTEHIEGVSLALVLSRDGETICHRAGREASGGPFNSLHQLKHDRAIPRNPFINAGALVVVDRLVSLIGQASAAVLDLLRTEAGNPAYAPHCGG